MECTLAKGELLRLDGGGCGVIIRCSGGELWLTCGDGADYLIRAGCSFELKSRLQAVVEALDGAAFSLQQAVRSGKRLQAGAMGLGYC